MHSKPGWQVFWQQAWAFPPQFEHAPLVQVPRWAPQLASFATQRSPTQQPPSLQAEPAQHA
jgi:hypothetical protein